MAATAAARVNLTGAMLEPFKDNASIFVVVTVTDDTGVVQFTPNTILKGNVSRLLDLPMDCLLSLLLEVCDNAVPGEGTNEELGLVAILLTASEGGRDTALEDLRKRSTIVGRAFEFLVANTTPSDISRSGMRCAVLGDSTYLLL